MGLESNVLFADTEEKITRVVGALLRARDRRDVVGFDTEFYGVDIGKQSTYGNARLHMFSVAVHRFPYVLHPRGYYMADAAVCLHTALPAFKEWLEDPEGQKVIHNAPVDIHTLANIGINIRGSINSLALSRWAWPGRARGTGFTLDSLGNELLGMGKTEKFTELFQEEYTERRSTFRKEKRCECGASPCRRRQTTPGHCRIEEVVETVHERQAMRPVPLESVVPGHPLWERAVRYAAQDAVMALGVYDLAQHAMKVERTAPWLVIPQKLSTTAPV